MKSLKMILASAMFLGVSLSACQPTDCVENVNSDCACIEIYDPVCGCNNKTYSNSCHAECAGITSYSSGKCW